MSMHPSPGRAEHRTLTGSHWSCRPNTPSAPLEPPPPTPRHRHTTLAHPDLLGSGAPERAKTQPGTATSAGSVVPTKTTGRVPPHP